MDLWLGYTTKNKVTGVGYYFDFPLLDSKRKPLFINKKSATMNYIDVSMLDITDYIFKFPDGPE